MTPPLYETPAPPSSSIQVTFAFFVGTPENRIARLPRYPDSPNMALGPRLGPPALTSSRRVACGTNASGAENAPRYSVQDVGDSPKLPRGRSAALSGELGGARNVPRNRAEKCRDAAGARTVCAAAGARWERDGYFSRLAWSKVGQMKTSAQNEDFGAIKGVRAGSSRENLRFSSWMSDQYI